MKRFVALALMTAATGAAVAMAASPAAAGHKGYDGYDGYYDLQRTVVEQGHGYGYWSDKDDKGKHWHKGHKDKGKDYGYYY
ncbi:hypothetical protein [Nocardiopsis valliformis]|uniref:hypothetical protein n=1 Tax=Nocardiopsis valliformis TaxID=239974 RepID=UPI000347E587|nr:hypothetical protein [Nocardiopsis valliformis]